MMLKLNSIPGKLPFDVVVHAAKMFLVSAVSVIVTVSTESALAFEKEMTPAKKLTGEIAKGLPYGEQRRLEIARALATGPKVLCLN